MIPQIPKNNRNITDTCLEGWGVGDTHITGSHIGGIHISLGICVRGYTYHGDTHITVTPVINDSKKECYLLIVINYSTTTTTFFTIYVTDDYTSPLQ